MANIAVLDFEAQSASTSTGKIISVSGILYNDQFQELDRFELFCRNVPGYIPIRDLGISNLFPLAQTFYLFSGSSDED